MKEQTAKNQSKRHFLRNERWIGIALFLIIYDVVAVSLSYYVALWLRFDCRFSLVPKDYFKTWLHFVPVYAVFCVFVFAFLRLYKSIWRFASYSELLRIIIASMITAVGHVSILYVLCQRFRKYFPVYRMPYSYYIIGAIIQFGMVLGIRFAYRFILLVASETGRNRARKGAD
ncbi:MAG: hypothetical protein K6F11_10685, partial [Lachnospiraceae bacterium]|nr:hypothetical protein [Lachnospiraceae bacterium]